MATIAENLQKIKNAVYGKDVRGAIHDSIEQMHEETQSYSQLVTQKAAAVDTAVTSAQSATSSANTAASAAASAAQRAETAADAVEALTSGVIDASVVNNALGYVPAKQSDVTALQNADTTMSGNITALQTGKADKTELTALAKSADLAAVATSGSYNDLSDKPVTTSLDLLWSGEQSLAGSTFNLNAQMSKYKMIVIKCTTYTAPIICFVGETLASVYTASKGDYSRLYGISFKLTWASDNSYFTATASTRIYYETGKYGSSTAGLTVEKIYGWR